MEINEKKARLFLAVLWSVVTLVWLIMAVTCLILWEFAGPILPVAASVAAALSLVNCVLHWRRFGKMP